MDRQVSFLQRRMVGHRFLSRKGSEGSRVVSWIRTGTYVFGLYGDAERSTSLTTVTVSGFAAELRNALARADYWADNSAGC